MPADDPVPYQRLPGSGGGGLQRCRLWLGPDHLLQVASSAVGERYKRFYFADIQALLLRPTVALFTWSLVWSAPILLFIVLGLSVETVAAMIPLFGVAACFLVILLVHLGFGATCAVTVRTAVQTETLPSLSRLRTARRVLAIVRPLIEAAQGSSAAPASDAEPLAETRSDQAADLY